MDFGASPREQALRSNARRLLEENCGSAYVRSMESTESGFEPEFLRRLAELGWTGMLVPVELGGLGLGASELSIHLQEVGRYATPGPILETLVHGGVAVAAMPDLVARAEALDDILAGRMHVANAMLGPSEHEIDTVETVATTDGHGYLIDGTKEFVRWGLGATDAVVLALNSDDRSPVLLLVDLASPGITRAPLMSVGSDGQANVTFSGVRVPQQRLIARGGDAITLIERIRRYARLALAAMMVGGATRLFEMGHQHALTRKQFGRPIGSFQVIQHQLVDVLADVERAQILLDQAAWMLGEGLECDQELLGLLSLAGQVYVDTSHTIGHIHGGYGLMKIHDVQLYYRRAKAFQSTDLPSSDSLLQLADLGYLRWQSDALEGSLSGRYLYPSTTTADAR
jgi:alkylation response protein AidB-like acyl-CoA dehydrogenase